MGFWVVQWHASSSTTERPLEREEDCSSLSADRLTLGLLPLWSLSHWCISYITAQTVRGRTRERERDRGRERKRQREWGLSATISVWTHLFPLWQRLIQRLPFTLWWTPLVIFWQMQTFPRLLASPQFVVFQQDVVSLSQNQAHLSYSSMRKERWKKKKMYTQMTEQGSMRTLRQFTVPQRNPILHQKPFNVDKDWGKASPHLPRPLGQRLAGKASVNAKQVRTSYFLSLMVTEFVKITCESSLGPRAPLLIPIHRERQGNNSPRGTPWFSRRWHDAAQGEKCSSAGCLYSCHCTNPKQETLPLTQAVRWMF